MNTNLGLVTTGGGARAAYQVGVVRAIFEITKTEHNLFNIITGNSAGAINSTYLASQAKNWDLATSHLVNLWKKLTPSNIFDLRTSTVSGLGLKWIGGTVFGGMTSKGSHINHLLHTDPLRELLKKEIDFSLIAQNVKDKTLKGVALSTTNFNSGSSVIFYQGDENISDWSRTDRFSLRGDINLNHVMGSSSIPFFFPPEKIGDSFYGDGCIRQTTPLSPSLHLGAEKIIAIGVRYPHNQQRMKDVSLSPFHNPTIGQIAGVMMNAVFLDSLEADVERLCKINSLLKGDKQSGFKSVPILMIRPSRDLGKMTEKLNKELPSMMKYLLKGIGVSAHEGLDLLSYLAFDESYTAPLIELGYEDTFKIKEDILNFIDA